MMKRKVRAIGFRVLVKLKKIEETLTPGGVIVRSEVQIGKEKRATQEAYVVEVGPQAFKDFGDGEPWCKEGDCVLIAKYSGDDMMDVEDDEVYRVINDRDIAAVFEGEEMKS